MEKEILDDNNHNRIRNVEYAGFGERLLASILDGLITMLPIGAFMYFGYVNKSLILLLVGAILGMLYKPLMEGLWGATLGKMILKIQMVDSDLDQIDLGQSLLKNAIYIVSSLIGILGHFWLVGTEAFQESEGFLEASAASQGSPYTTITYVWVGVMFISCFAMLASDLKQTLHDKLAGTYCVKNSTFDQY